MVTLQDGSRSAPTYQEIPSVERFEVDVDLSPGIVPQKGQDFGVTVVNVQLACIRGVAELYDCFVSDGLHRDRHCPAWYAYMPGFSPQEHLRDFRMQELEELRRQTDDARERDRRAYEERTEERRREFEKELTERSQITRQEFDRADQLQNRRLMKMGIIFAAILGLLQIIAAIIGALLTNSHPGP